MRAEKLDTEIRQEQIAQAALSLISSGGLKGLSVARVARRVGLVPSAIYRHFRSKDEVLDAAVGYIQERLLGNVHAVCDETEDALERLRKLLMRHIGLIRENQGIPRIIFSEEFYDGRPERKARVYGIIKQYLNRVSQIVRQGQQGGRIRPELDPGVVAVMFLGLIQPTAILWHMSQGEFDAARHAEKSWLIFSGAIGAE